jgi:hypothetical protein
MIIGTLALDAVFIRKAHLKSAGTLIKCSTAKMNVGSMRAHVQSSRYMEEET